MRAVRLMGTEGGKAMRIIAGGRGVGNPFGAIARPYLDKFYQQVDEMRGGTKLELAFNRLTIAEKRVVFILGNAKAENMPERMSKLTERHIDIGLRQLTDKEQVTAITGLREVKKLADKIPYSRPGEEKALSDPHQPGAPDTGNAAGF